MHHQLIYAAMAALLWLFAGDVPEGYASGAEDGSITTAELQAAPAAAPPTKSAAAPPAAPAGGTPPAITHPEKAPCLVCSRMGSGHGAEKVAGFSEHEGAFYYFCSEKCKDTFDADPASWVPLPIPRPVPPVRVQTMEGQDLTLQDYRGTVLLIDFWATWCKPCLKIIPHFEELHRDLGLEGFAVLGVSIDENPETAASYVSKKEIAYPILFDLNEGPAWEAFGVKAIPATFLVDRNGTILREWTGNDIDHDDIEAAVKEVLAAQKKH
jgi:peroxiredoxin